MICDIAVIGAGPAGSIFASQLAQKAPELKIALIDGQDETRKKVCGGLLAPDAQKVLAGFDLSLPKSILADPQIFDVETIDLELGIKRNYQRHYLNMDRFAFDRFMLSLVPGSVHIVSARCIGIEKKEGSFTLHLDGEAEPLTAKQLVGADGASSLVRRTFLRGDVYKYVSIQQWFPADGEGVPNYSCIFDRKTSDSCSWTIKKDGYIIFGGAFKKDGSRGAFEEQKKRLENYLGRSLGEPERTEACLLTSPRRARDLVPGRNGVFLIGEAAGFISSSSFEGISSALLSGKYLAEAFARKHTEGYSAVLRLYRRKTLRLRRRLMLKIPKMRVLCSPFLRALIMKSGLRSIKKF